MQATPGPRPPGAEAGAARQPVLSIRDLVTEFRTPDGVLRAVDHVSYDVLPGETLGVVGESGSGKSVTVMSLLGLIPSPPGRVIGGQALFQGRDLLTLSRKELRRIRGKEIAMIFQDPMTSLNPVLTIGGQIAEAMSSHDADLSDEAARRRSVELLDMVGVPNADARFDEYPHQFSGGMRQRAMIAMAIANGPKLLIADEPTTALDVTIQAQVLEVLARVQQQTDAATIMITHDLGVIAETADRVVVMYGGRVVETGDVRTIFHAPRHPYTVGLMSSMPRLDSDIAELAPIPGQPPSLLDLPTGCAFHPRCRLSRGRQRCRTEVPPLYPTQPGHRSACHFHEEVDDEVRRVSSRMGVDLPGGSA